VLRCQCQSYYTSLALERLVYGTYHCLRLSSRTYLPYSLTLLTMEKGSLVYIL
tara:strand:+ start:47549 stop:47707 length:159 start_codon:yes stop_codon:yes gene_type:complete